MILYHHTDPSYLPSILERGLLARPWCGGDDPELSVILHHRSVVWLTTQRSTLFTAADVAVLRRLGHEDEAATGTWLHRCSHPVSLRIDIPRHSRKLIHFLTWVKKNARVIIYEDGAARCSDDGELMTTASLVEDYIPSGARWYVYFGDIRPKWITPIARR